MSIRKQLRQSIHTALTERAAADRQLKELEDKVKQEKVKREQKIAEDMAEDYEAYKHLPSKIRKQFQKERDGQRQSEDDDLLGGF